MNATFVEKANNVVKFTVEVDGAAFEKGLAYAYNQNKNKISLPGFRRGKAPRKLIEAQYGANFFYEEAINHIFPDVYEEAIDELKLDVVSRPTIDVENINKETGVKFIVEVTVKPEVTLGQYKGLKVEKEPVEVTEEEVEKELKSIQEKNARLVEVTDRAAENGDVAKISYLGTVDGVAFEGGQADNHDLTLGSHAFIEGFEEQIVGHNVGDKFDVNVTFPEAYHAPELSGKAAVFAVELKGLSKRELPELNDEFAEDVSEFSTLDEYKASIQDKLKKEKEEKAKQIQSDKLLDAAIANCTMDVPQVMYDNKIDQMMREFEENITRQGLTMDIYCKYMGTTKEDVKENFRETSEKSVRARLMLEQIVKEENLTVSEEALKEEIGRFGESYGIDAEKMIEMFREEDKEALKEDMLVKQALKLIEDSAEEVEKA
ncbi:MAG TPA: trigger factor [Candidatus Coprocola pullicola]|nr:trigger factor [Candidatus Coprocola pullicola]